MICFPTILYSLGVILQMPFPLSLKRQHLNSEFCFVYAIHFEESTATKFLEESLGLGLTTLVHQGHHVRD